MGCSVLSSLDVVSLGRTPGVGEAEIAFFVHQAYRQRGIGTALVKAVLRWAEQRSLRRVWAMSVAENVLAMRLLKRCGFRFLQDRTGNKKLAREG